MICISLVVIGLSIYTWIDQGGAKYGIDFVGGHELIVQIKEDASSDSVRAALAGENLESLVVQAYDSASNEFAVRVGGAVGDADGVLSTITTALTAKFPAGIDVLQTNYIGPTIGSELRKKALIAITLGLVAILIYIGVRFEFSFALGAVVAVFHDVIVSVGVYIMTGNSINMGTIAAALTIVGYSVNDTIVIYDRVREEIFKAKNFDLREIMNYSMTVTLSRTIITSLLTLFSAVALLIWGGGAIRELSICLVAGLIAGTYSTMFIASPVTLLIDRIRHSQSDNKAKSAATTA